MITKLSYNNNDTHLKNCINILNHIIKALEGFENNYDKKFNFSKLITQLEIYPSLMDEIIYLLLDFQELFCTTFKNYHLTKQITDKTVFFITEKNKEQIILPTKILIRKTHLRIFNDIVYVFRFIKRGKGFNIETNGSDLLKKVKELREYYPYFFSIHDNLIYLSPLGLELGELLLSYNKSNKEVEAFSLKQYFIEVISDE